MRISQLILPAVFGLSMMAGGPALAQTWRDDDRTRHMFRWDDNRGWERNRAHRYYSERDGRYYYRNYDRDRDDNWRFHNRDRDWRYDRDRDGRYGRDWRYDRDRDGRRYDRDRDGAYYYRDRSGDRRLYRPWVDERSVTYGQLPDDVQRTINHYRRGDPIRRIERVRTDDRTFYRVSINGRRGDRVLRISPDGKLESAD